MGSSSSQISDEEHMCNVAGEVKESIAEDSSLPNLMSGFSRLLHSPKFDDFNTVVREMKDNWNKILKSLDGMSEYVSSKEVNEMRAIHNSYWVLLLKTRSVIHALVKKSQLLRRDIKLLSSILYRCKNGALSIDDNRTHSECVREICNWLNTGGLNGLLVEWGQIRTRLEKKQLSWSKIFRNFEDASSSIGWTCLKWLSIVVVGAAVIISIMCSVAGLLYITGGIGAAAASAEAAKTITIFGGTLLKSHVIGFVGGGGVAVVAGCVRVGACKYRKCTNATYAAYCATEVVTQNIKHMLKNSRNVENKISKLKEIKNGDVNAEYEYIRNARSRDRMRESLQSIDDHLSEYIKGGQRVIKTVDEACRELVANAK